MWKLIQQFTAYGTKISESCQDEQIKPNYLGFFFEGCTNVLALMYHVILVVFTIEVGDYYKILPFVHLPFEPALQEHLTEIISPSNIFSLFLTNFLTTIGEFFRSTGYKKILDVFSLLTNSICWIQTTGLKFKNSWSPWQVM